MHWQALLNSAVSANWILLMAVHSLWILLISILVLRLPKFRSPVVRSAWCTSALLLLLVLPLLSRAVPQYSVPAQPAAPVSIETSTTNAEIAKSFLDSVLDANSWFPREQVDRWKAPMNLLGVLWLLVTLICAGRLLYQLAFLKGYCADLLEIHDDRLTALVREIRPSFHFRREPRFFVSPRLESPVSTGIHTPWVILPSALYQDIGTNELRAILLHELAHIYHQDHLLGLLQRVVKALYWWNPLVYVLSNSLSVAREEVSDNYAISGMESPACYARLLVSLVEKTSLISRMPCTAGMGTPYELLEGRIKNILSRERDMQVNISRQMLSLILLTSVLLCAMVVMAGPVAVFGGNQVSAESPKAINLAGEAPASKLIRKVDPVYPREALKNRISAKVTLKIHVNADGNVTEAQVLQGHPLFNDSAIAAVRQWQYSPTLLNGKPVPVTATVTVVFSLNGNESPRAAAPASRPLNAALPASKLIHKVDPIYPEEALKARMSSTVTLRINVNAEGSVTSAEVINGHPVFNDSAIAAVKQWQYSPTLLNGKPVPVTATVTVVFSLNRGMDH